MTGTSDESEFCGIGRLRAFTVFSLTRHTRRDDLLTVFLLLISHSSRLCGNCIAIRSMSLIPPGTLGRIKS